MQLALGLTIFTALLGSSNGMEVALKEDDSTLSVVSKVAKLLEDMIKEMEKDADDDQDVADKMSCWCETGEKEKTKAIAVGTQKVEDLQAEIQALTAKSQQLNTEIDKISKELGENQKSLETSIDMRKKEMEEFNTAEASTAESIKQLTGASAALSRNKDLMQTKSTFDDSTPAYHAIKDAIRNHGDLLWARHNDEAREILKHLMTHNHDLSLLQTDSKAKITAPSDSIVGTINTMNNVFKENLQRLQNNENSAQEAHAAAKTEKEKEMAAAIAMIDEKTGIVADTDEKNAASKEDLKDTMAILVDDQEYLKKVKEQCEIFSNEFEARKETRLEEIGACSKALEYLTSDEAKDLFTNTLGSKRKEKLGSKNLAEFKEARDTESMRSQTAKARKEMWGTSERYLLAQKEVNFLQISSDIDEQPSLAKEESDILDLERADLKDYLKDYKPHNEDAKKLATLAKRTEVFWAARYYSDALKANASKALAIKEKIDMVSEAHREHLKHPEEYGYHTQKPHKAKKYLGLTASEVKVRKSAMDVAGQALGKLIAELKIQQGEETSKYEWCQDEILAVESELAKERIKKDRHYEKIKSLKKDRDEIKNEVKLLNYDQEDADIELQKAANDRRKADQSFQETVMNQLNTGRLLKKALEVLKSFYEKKKKASLLSQKAIVASNNEVKRIHEWMDRFSAKAAVLLQKSDTDRPSTQVTTWLNEAEASEADANAYLKRSEALTRPAAVMLQQEPAGPPPPAGFKSYEKSRSSGGVTVMIENLIDDADAMVKDAVKDATSGLTAYEEFVAGANTATKQRQKDITDRNARLGKILAFLDEAEEKLKETEFKIKTLRQKDIDLYGAEGCDYLEKNYESRYEARQDEINSLGETMSLIGAAYGNEEANPEAQKLDKAMGEEKEEGESPGQVPSEHKVVPDGVEVIGPNGERAVEKIATPK